MTRKGFSICLVLALAMLGVFTMLMSITPLAYGASSQWLKPPYDFTLRMTELKCLRQGVNPFDVWHGDVVLPPFRPNYGSKVSGPEFNEDINAYAPWEYTAMLPLSFLPIKAAWVLYYLVMLASMGYVLYAGYSFGLSRWGSRVDGVILSTVPVLLTAYPSWSNICIGNFSVIVLAAVVGAARCLDRGRDVLAGLCWAVAMLKPQLGTAMAIPILMRGKWLTLLVAVGTCFLATIPPAVMCRTSPITLILQTPAANTFMFKGCGTLPYFLCGRIGEGYDIVVALAVGVVVCCMMQRMLSFASSWMVYMMPAAVCAMSWTYASTYGHVMGYFFFFLLTLLLIEGASRAALWVIAALSLLSTTRVYNCYRGFTSAFAQCFPALGYSEEFHYHLDSVNSSIDVLLAIALCVWFKNNSKERFA